MQISVEVEGASKVSVFLDAFPRETGRAILRALRRGKEMAQTRANRVISQDMGLKVGDVRKRIRLIEPTAETLAYELRGSLKRIPLIEFGARGPEPSRGKGRGVSYRIGSGGRGRHAHAFITTVGSHRGVFERKPGASRRGPAPNRSQLPIKELFGPSIGRVMDKHRSEIVSVGESAFKNELDRLLNRIIQGGVGDAG
jgi:hypothetical protein